MTPLAIKRKYAKRIVKILNNIRDQLTGAGYECEEVEDESCDQYVWSFICHDDAEDIVISFTIAESEEYDNKEGGVNFMLDIVAVGGIIIGGLTPYNYTPEVWVSRKDKLAVEERFCIMEEADPSTIPGLIADHLVVG